MRRWKNVGSVESIHSRQNSQIKSNRSRSHKSRNQSPFSNFRHNIQNQSDNLIEDKDRTFCYSYMQRKRQNARTMTIDMSREQRVKHSLRGDDIFTQMRNALKEDQNVSRVTTKSLSDPQSKTNGDQKEKKKELLKKTNSKIKHLKKEQGKLKRNVESDVQAMKNMFYQLEEVLHSQQGQQKAAAPEKGRENCDSQFIRQILAEAISVERHCQELQRKKREILKIFQNQ